MTQAMGRWVVFGTTKNAPTHLVFAVLSYSGVVVTGLCVRVGAVLALLGSFSASASLILHYGRRTQPLKQLERNSIFFQEGRGLIPKKTLILNLGNLRLLRTTNTEVDRFCI